MRMFRIGGKQGVMIVLLFTGVVGVLVMGAVTIAAVSDSETMSCYSGNKQISAKAGDLRRLEAASVRSGYEQWRGHAAMVAAVEAPYLRPPVVWGEAPTWKLSTSKEIPVLNIDTPTWGAEYRVLFQDSDESKVVLAIKDAPRFTFTLRKPFGDWWYITEICDMLRSGAGPEAARGVQLVELRPAVMKHGMKLVWDPESKLAEVSGSNMKVTMQVGYNQTRINGREFSCSACPMLIKGKVFVAEDVISRIIAESLVYRQVK